MPFGEVSLIPGVNVERTPTLLTAAVSQSQLIRYKDSLVQKYGGWQQYYQSTVAAIPRELHAWQDLEGVDHLLVGSTSQLAIITNGSLDNITPQTLLSNFAPNFSTVINTPTVTIDDPNVSNVTTDDAVFFNTPVSVDGIILSGIYPIVAVVSTHVYKITAATNAVAGVTDLGAVPVFTTTSGSSIVTVTLDAHNLTTTSVIVFQIVTTGNGVSIFGNYTPIAIVDANNFNIAASSQATASSSFDMNASEAQLVYYINLGPPALGSGYGTGGYGSGGYGVGTSSSVQTGTPITATDWTSDNWGEIALACPAGGGVYQFDPTAGFANAALVETAPTFNGGLFVSMTYQILVCWASSVIQTIGMQQDPLTVNWSTVGDYTTFTPLATNQAGSFRIPIGSKIMGGMAVSNQNLIWTDLDCWAMNYQGPPFVFGFNKIGAGAGLISSHAAQQLRGNVYWMGQSNFYSYTPNGVAVIPCPVWDAVFQNLNPNSNPMTGIPYTANIRSMPNTPFNEVGFLYPSVNSSNGECDSYVKFNITEPNAPWDYGLLQRSAWTDQTILGPPIGATSGGIIYQHETTNDAAGQPLVASFTTGYFYLAEGEDFVFVDWFLPDFKYGTYSGSSGANISMTFNVINYPSDSPTVYGPYVVTDSTEFIPVRFRGRQVSITIQSSDLGSFWRIGKIRYRFAPAGRR